MESLAYTAGLQYELNEKTIFPFYYQNKKMETNEIHFQFENTLLVTALYIPKQNKNV